VKLLQQSRMRSGNGILKCPKKTIVGLRNKVIHHYFAVDHEVIWQIATKNIPATKEKIAEILREYSR
jgi:uncharacterized protein with HEPN domain